MNHEQVMKKVLKIAEKALAEDTFPVGCRFGYVAKICFLTEVVMD